MKLLDLRAHAPESRPLKVAIVLGNILVTFVALGGIFLGIVIFA